MPAVAMAPPLSSTLIIIFRSRGKPFIVACRRSGGHSWGGPTERRHGVTVGRGSWGRNASAAPPNNDARRALWRQRTRRNGSDCGCCWRSDAFAWADRRAQQRRARGRSGNSGARLTSIALVGWKGRENNGVVPSRCCRKSAVHEPRRPAVAIAAPLAAAATRRLGRWRWGRNCPRRVASSSF